MASWWIQVATSEYTGQPRTIRLLGIWSVRKKETGQCSYLRGWADSGEALSCSECIEPHLGKLGFAINCRHETNTWTTRQSSRLHRGFQMARHHLHTFSPAAERRKGRTEVSHHQHLGTLV
ncbi:hypothetical protein BB8028_0005g03740 [Beauveria bassiana]|uniref:Uncharacterized protein n=1 Tax=Beauveria bassiana TaxID=176275 RepID=A0A2S7YF81_BEABA|nr:hypothetical protein BB8028_0005g03740 [Beauveria bassiana]